MAAADHCLAAAYQGRCPGVDPDRLMAWRVATCARHQGITQKTLLRQIRAAQEVLRDAPHILLAGKPVADLRGQAIPELREAIAREGIPVLATSKVCQGMFTKVILQVASPEQVREFLEEWGPQQGLQDLYGDPSRGFAGGILPAFPAPSGGNRQPAGQN